MRLLSALFAIVLVAAITMAFGVAFTLWHGMGQAGAASVLVLYAAAAALTILLFLAGQMMSIQSHAYYLIAAGAVFLCLDVLMWQTFGIMPGRKVFRDGFIPAAIMGLFLGPLYKLIAVPLPAMPRS